MTPLLALGAGALLAAALLLGRRRARRRGIPAPTSVLTKNPAAAERDLDGERVIFVRGAAEGLALSEVARRCWDLLDGSRTLLEIALILARESGVARTTALKEVRTLAARLKHALLALEKAEWALLHVHQHEVFAGAGGGGIVEVRLGEQVVIHAPEAIKAPDGSLQPWLCEGLARRRAAASLARHADGEALREEAARAFQAGWEFCAAGRLADAERAYRECSGKAPGWANAHYQLGYVRLLGRRYGEAIGSLEKAEELSPGYFMVREYLDQARKLLSGDLSHEAFLLLDRANAAGLRDPDATIRLVRKALQICPGFPTARLVLARAYQQKEMLGEALEEIDRTLGMDPDPATLCNALLSRGAIHMAMGRSETAVRDWEAVIRLNGSASATRAALSTIAASPVTH